MDKHLFRPQLFELESRDTPAGLSPNDVTFAAFVVKYDAAVVSYALANFDLLQSPAQGQAKVIFQIDIGQSQLEAPILNQYVQQLQAQSAANPAVAAYLAPTLSQYQQLRHRRLPTSRCLRGSRTTSRLIRHRRLARPPAQPPVSRRRFQRGR